MTFYGQHTARTGFLDKLYAAVNDAALGFYPDGTVALRFTSYTEYPSQTPGVFTSAKSVHDVHNLK